MASETELLRREMHQLRETMSALQTDLKEMLEVKANVKFQAETLARHERDIRDLYLQVKDNTVEQAGVKPRVNNSERFVWLLVTSMVGVIGFALRGGVS